MDIPSDVPAYVVLYDPDLSSKPMGFVERFSDVAEEVRKAWMAVVVYRKDSECVMAVLRRGSKIREVGIERGFYVYGDVKAVLKRDLSMVREICGDSK